MQSPQEKSTLVPIESTSNPSIFLSAGEASGDHYGAQLIAELRTRLPHLAAFGLGGREMEAAGQQRVVRAEDVAHMGITEVLRHAPRVYHSYRRLVASIKQRRPDIAVLIDFPDVNLRLARELRKLNIPVVYFVSPQLWAWKRKRLRWVQQRVTRMMVIFPFEAPFYQHRNVTAEFVGHPLAYLPPPTTTREDFASVVSKISQDHWHYSCGIVDFPNLSPLQDWASPDTDGKIKYKLDLRKPWIALLPGSRMGEIMSNLWGMVEAAYLLGDEYEFLVPIAKTITNEQLNRIQYELGDGCLSKPHPPRITLVSDAPEALHHARASIVASGTATVQAAVIGNPFVVVYKVSPLTFAVAKQLIHYPPEIPAQPDTHGNLPIGMVNLIAGRRIVPEFLQQQFTAANLAAALKPLLEDTPDRARMISDLAEVRHCLMPDSTHTPIQRVADAVELLLRQPATSNGQIAASRV